MSNKLTVKSAVGLMSGTSMDGIDVAHIRSDGEGFLQRCGGAFYPYDIKTRAMILKALENSHNIKLRNFRDSELINLEQHLTNLHAIAVDTFLNSQNLKKSAIDLIGFHGQTILHKPDAGLTLQLGDGQKLSQLCGIPVMYDMRANDMVCGGQGAPLAPIYHQILAKQIESSSEYSLPMMIVNIGGISNITYLGEDDLMLAFDCGPGNNLIDQWVTRYAGIPYDEDGMIAAEGGVNAQLVNRYLANPFFHEVERRSLDRSDFTLDQMGNVGLENGARSLAFLTAASIIKVLDHLPTPPKLLVVTGGGRRNPHVMEDLKVAMRRFGKVLRAEDVGLNGDLMEAEAWAYLAIRSQKMLPIGFKTTTGASRSSVGGVLALVPAH